MKYKKVTEKMKEKIRKMKLKGISNKEIAKKLEISESTVSYHSNERYRQLAIERAARNERSRDRLEYMRKYQSDRYANDEEYREMIKRLNRDNWRKKHGTNNNIHKN